MPTTAYSFPRMLSFGCGVVFAVAVLCNVGLSGEDPPIAFGANVQAILKTHCTACHGQNVQEGGLNLTERDRLLAGGESGPAIVPGAPEASLLLQKILLAMLKHSSDMFNRSTQNSNSSADALFKI